MSVESAAFHIFLNMLAVEEFSLSPLQAQCQNAFPKMNLAPPFVHLEIPGSISSRISAAVCYLALDQKLQVEICYQN